MVGDNCVVNFLESLGLAPHGCLSLQSTLIPKAHHRAAPSFLLEPSPLLLRALLAPLGHNQIVGVCLGDIYHRITAPGSRLHDCDMMTVYFTPFSFPAGIRRFKDTGNVFLNLREGH